MSEVARLMQQIEIACEAMKVAMTGFRMAASHEIINRQYEQLREHYESLGKFIGEKQAVEFAIGALDMALESEDPINGSASTFCTDNSISKKAFSPPQQMQ